MAQPKTPAIMISKYRMASEQYLTSIKDDPLVIGVILSGSVAHSLPDPNSDVDIFVILDDEADFRERGNLMIDGIEVEYFKNPVKQIRSYFRQESSPHTAHILAHGEILLDRSPLVNNLIEEAHELLKKGPPPMSAIHRELLRYGIDDKWKDFMDCQAKEDEVGATLVSRNLINLCLQAFCLHHQIWHDKEKRLLSQLNQTSPAFARLFKDATLAPVSEQALSALVTETERLLGGGRPTPWTLRSGLKLSPPHHE